MSEIQQEGLEKRLFGAIGNQSHRVTKLIVPGNNAVLIEKAASSEADIVHLEMEDGVPPDQKPEARLIVRKALTSHDWSGKEVWIRVNPISGTETEADIAEIAPGGPTAFYLAKAQGPSDVAALSSMLADAERSLRIPDGSFKIAVVLERIRALAAVEELASCDPRMTALVFGPGDMSNEFGYRRDSRGLSLETLYIRSRMVLASRLAGIHCLDAAHPYYKELENTEASARFSAQLGFDGKTVLSPRQIPYVKRGFAPEDEEIQWAHAVLRGFEEAKSEGRAVWVVDGAMVDAPHVTQANRILARAEQLAVG